jgi:hypothetical protein
MRRRTFLTSTLALGIPGLAGCGLLPPSHLAIVCDPDLAEALDRAASAWPGRRGGTWTVETDISERQLGALMEGLQGGVIVTREPKQANRIQRMGLSRLENRWTRQLDGGPVAIVVTHGDWQAAAQAKAFAKWLAGPGADRALTAGGPRVRSAV